MEHKTDNIYIYLWEELNTIYIGRTINPKSRNYQHKHVESEITYKFSSKHHVEHPKMIIIESDLNIEEGVEREKYWIRYYKENSLYNVLNKTCGGQIGNVKTRKVLTEEEKKKHRKESNRKRNLTDKRKDYNKKYNKKYYEKNKEKILIQMKEYREDEKNREKILIQRKKYREDEKNREKILAQKRRYRERHREEIRLKAREYQKEKRKRIS